MKRPIRILILFIMGLAALFSTRCSIFGTLGRWTTGISGLAALNSNGVFYTVFIFKIPRSTGVEWMKQPVCILEDAAYFPRGTEEALTAIGATGSQQHLTLNQAEAEWKAGNLNAVGFTAPEKEVCGIIQIFREEAKQGGFECTVYNAFELMGKIDVAPLPNSKKCEGIPSVTVIIWR